MYLKYLFVLGIALATGWLGCTTPPPPTVWPEPRALGNTLPTYTPPLQPSVAPPSARDIPEPGGVLTLLQAQTLAVQHNPKLAAFG
jgi:hypothetical protein